MIKTKSIIIISSIDWHFNWQGPQEIATRLAKSGNKVLFVENLGVRKPKLKDFSRIWMRLINSFRSKFSFNANQISLNLSICSPLALPPFGPRVCQYLNRKIFLPKIKKTADKLGLINPVILTFLPTDTVNTLIGLFDLDNCKVVYYVAADFAELVDNPDHLKQSEQNLAKVSDVVFTICNQLTERFYNFNKNTYTLSYGVDTSTFNLTNGSFPYEISKIKSEKKPIIGYVGALHRHVNFDLLEKSVKERNDWNWIFVGPIEEQINRLKKLPNTIFTGPQLHKNLVHYINSFDVCIIPYLNNSFTSTVMPVKLNEYLAVGKPIVATKIPVVSEFNKTYQVFDICEHNSGDFINKIEKCLAEKQNPKLIKKRKAVARQSDWQSHLNSICQIINSVEK